MTIYVVHLDAHADIAAQFRAWLDDHIAAMVALPGFVRAELFQREEDGGHFAVKYTVFYYVDSRAALQRYFDEYAAAMRSDGPDRFGGRFEVSRQTLVAL